MANLGDVGTSSFDAYEGIRIFIPGAVTFALGVFAMTTVSPGIADKVRSDAVVSLIASVMIGLVLYYWDFPAKAAANFQDQPTGWLEEQYPDKTPGELVSAYLEILNTVVPPTIRNRALYMGSMYRIGLELILALATSAAFVFSYSQWRSEPGITALRLMSHQVWAAVAVLIVFTFAFLISVGYQRKVDFRTKRTSTGLVLGSLQAFRAVSMLIYAAGICLIVAGQIFYYKYPAMPRLFFDVLDLLGFVICFGYWVTRYVRGDRTSGGDPRKRSPISAPASAILLILPVLWAMISRASGPLDPLASDAYLGGWTCVLGIAVLSIVLRGHERKLHGSYIGQTRWLQHNVALYKRLITGEPAEPFEGNLNSSNQPKIEAQVCAADPVTTAGSGHGGFFGRVSNFFGRNSKG